MEIAVAIYAYLGYEGSAERRYGTRVEERGGVLKFTIPKVWPVSYRRGVIFRARVQTSYGIVMIDVAAVSITQKIKIP